MNPDSKINKIRGQANNIIGDVSENVIYSIPSCYMLKRDTTLCHMT
jgi:hypothetical protein